MADRVLQVMMMILMMIMMTGFSRVLSSSQQSRLFHSLPPRAQLEPWSLLYCLSRDGCSLKTLYSTIKFDNCNFLLIFQVLQH